MLDLARSDEFPLSYAGAAVMLRPSLRAAMLLERLHGGFPGLLAKLDSFDTVTIRAVIRIGATDRKEALHFLDKSANAPLRDFRNAVLSPVLALVTAMLVPADDAQSASSAAAPMSWQRAHAELFRIATGWLGWPPATAWAATPAEIVEAQNGHVAMLTILHGGAQDADKGIDTSDPVDPETGLDPRFDRAGLAALKAKMKG